MSEPRHPEIDAALCDCPDGYPSYGVGKYKHLASCRYGVIEDWLDTEAAARPSDDLTGVDVERLAEAMRRFYIKQPNTFDTTAAAIAAIYERLARLEPGEGET